MKNVVSITELSKRINDRYLPTLKLIQRRIEADKRFNKYKYMIYHNFKRIK